MADPRKYLQTLITADAGFIKTDSHSVHLMPNGHIVKLMGYLQEGTYTKKCYKNENNGTGSWPEIAEFPGSARHWFTSWNVGYKIYVAGGDGNLDMWEYDYQTNEWTLITADLGIGIIYISGRGTDGTHGLILGGQDTGGGSGSPIALKKVLRISVTGSVEELGDLPTDYTSAGAFYKLTSTHWIYIPGGLYGAEGNVFYSNQITETLDAGLTWEVLEEELPEFMKGLYPSNTIWNGVAWFQVPNVDDGLFYSGDFCRSWLKAPYSPRKRHASGMMPNTLDQMLTIGGMNAETSQVEADIYKYEKVPF